MLIVVGEIGVEEVEIDIIAGGGIEVEVEGIGIEVGGVIVERIVVEVIIVRGGDREIRGEEIGVDAVGSDEKMHHLLERRGFLGEKNNSKKVRGNLRRRRGGL